MIDHVEWFLLGDDEIVNEGDEYFQIHPMIDENKWVKCVGLLVGCRAGESKIPLRRRNPNYVKQLKTDANISKRQFIEQYINEREIPPQRLVEAVECISEAYDKMIELCNDN